MLNWEALMLVVVKFPLKKSILLISLEQCLILIFIICKIELIL